MTVVVLKMLLHWRVALLATRAGTWHQLRLSILGSRRWAEGLTTLRRERIIVLSEGLRMGVGVVLGLGQSHLIHSAVPTANVHLPLL